MHETTAEQKESRSPEAPADIVIMFVLMNQPIRLHDLMDFNRAFQQYDTLDGANCLTVGKRHLSQREAAMEAVQAIGLNQICDVEGSVFVGYEQYGKMFSNRLEEITSEFVRDCGE